MALVVLRHSWQHLLTPARTLYIRSHIEGSVKKHATAGCMMATQSTLHKGHWRIRCRCKASSLAYAELSQGRHKSA